MRKALQDIAVLDMGQVVAGPYAAWLLACLGARVIKLEGPAGDPMRGVSRRYQGISYSWVLYNRGKKSMTLNLKTPKGREIFKVLIKRVDVLIENFVPGTMEDWGLSYEVLSEINPRLIYASVSGFGRHSIYKNLPANDVTIQAMGGGMPSTGFPGNPPSVSAVPYMDVMTPAFFGMSILAALFAREKTGHGQYVEVAMRDVSVAIPFNLYNAYFETGRSPQQMGNQWFGSAPANTFETKDGYAFIMAQSDKRSQALFRLMGKEDLIVDEKFSTPLNRWRNREELGRIIEKWTRTKTKWEIYELLSGVEVPCGMVLNIEEVLNDEDLNKRGVFVEIDQPGMQRIKVYRSPMRLSDSPEVIETAPLFGEHNKELYQELLGYDEGALDQLKKEGVVP